MPEWRETLSLKGVWKDEGRAEHCIRPIVTTVLAWCEKKAKTKEYEFDGDLEEVIDEFKRLLKAAPKRDITPWSLELRKRFDKIWSHFYDWCDAERVWVRLY